MSTVKIIGTGLLGTSIGLRLRNAGRRVLLADASPTTALLARDLGAGELDDGSQPDLVVVAVPPDVAAGRIVAALREHPEATVTDVASIKSALLEQVRDQVSRAELDRYIGSHPMAGREKSGAVAARHDLFIGRPWVVCSDADTPADRLAQVRELISLMGASAVDLEPDFHDAAVARVSHAPQVVASVMAAQLVEAPAEGIALAGQGLRDVTRIAASDPGLWAQILSGNAAETRAVLQDVRADLDRVIDALELGPGAIAQLAGTIAAGNDGHDRIPGKHGRPAQRFEAVTVLIADRPGTLAALFSEMDDIGINIEDLSIEHAAGQQLGIVEVSVVPQEAQRLIEELRHRGWQVPIERITEESE